MSILSKTKDLFRRDKQEKKASAKSSRKTSAKASVGKSAGAAGDEKLPETTSKVKGAVLKTGLVPLVTEKGMTLQAKAQTAVFRVKDSASKHDIGRAIEEQYSVKPLSIHTVTMRGKRRMRGRNVGFTAGWKKAYVKVKDVQKLHVAP